jgi:hypothetical protein
MYGSFVLASVNTLANQSAFPSACVVVLVQAGCVQLLPEALLTHQTCFPSSLFRPINLDIHIVALDPYQISRNA